MIIKEEHIGGATVNRLFNSPANPVRVGMTLTREQVLAYPSRNRQSLIDGGYLSIHPRVPAGETHIVSRGFGKFDVIEGRKLNVDPLESKEEAEALVAALKGQTQ